MRALTTQPPPPSKYKAIIIGAGFAGLAAGLALQRGGLHPHDFVILEARDRVGGRAHTLSASDDLSLELGATWIHGVGTPEHPNPVLAEAVAVGLMAPHPPRQRWWSSRFLLPHQSEALDESQEMVIHKAVEAYAAAVEGVDVASRGTVGDAVWRAWTLWREQHMQDWQGEGRDGEENLAAAAWRWRERLQRAIDGCHSTSDMHAGARAVYSEFGGTEVHAAVPGGYQSIAQSMSKGLNVLLEHEVGSIAWGEEGVTVTLVDQRQFHGDAAVVTASLGVLKARHAELFTPRLPQDVIGAIERLSIGTVDKIFVDFEATKEPGDGSQCGGTMLDPDQNVATYSLLWPADAISAEEDDSGMSGDLASVPSWAQGIFSIRFGGPEFKRKAPTTTASTGSSAPPGGPSADDPDQENAEESSEEEDAMAEGPPVHAQAVVWLTGKEAVAAEALSDAELLSGLRAAVDAFPGVQLPEGADWNRARVIRSRWGSDPFAAGSYSYVGQGSSPADVAALAGGVAVKGPAGGERVVVAFAGEACHLEHIGTTTGAYLTGRQQAKRLLECYAGAWGCAAQQSD